jgi:hypothetical protein
MNKQILINKITDQHLETLKILIKFLIKLKLKIKLKIQKFRIK